MEDLLLSFGITLLNLKQQFIDKEIRIRHYHVREHKKVPRTGSHNRKYWLSAPIFCTIYQTSLITGFQLSLPLGNPLGSGDKTPVWGLQFKVFFSPQSQGTLVGRRCLTPPYILLPSIACKGQESPVRIWYIDLSLMDLHLMNPWSPVEGGAYVEWNDRAQLDLWFLI